MIQWNEETLENEASVTMILEQATAEWQKRSKLYERLIRKTNKSALATEGDETIKIPLEWYITNMYTGYFAGKEPKYTVNKTIDKETQNIIKKLFKKMFGKNNKPEELKALIDYIAKYNDDATEFFNLAFDLFSKTACYEVVYENKDNEIVYSKLDALNTIAIWDYSAPLNQIGQLRRWEEVDNKNNKITILELTTKKGKFYYYPTPENTKKFKENKERRLGNKWEDLPCSAIENEHGLACFELVLGIITAYERVIQNTRNTFKYNDEAKLKIVGFSPEHDLTIQNDKGEWVENPARKKEDDLIVKAKTFYVPESGDVSWIEKDVKDTALQNHKKTLIDLITIITGVPNITDLGFTSADNASALDRKFFSLEQMVTNADKDFKKMLQRRWELIVGKINKKKKTNFDFRDIGIKLIRNLPTDKKTETDRALSLRGLLCDETIIDMLPDDLNTKAEIEKMDRQEEIKINSSNEKYEAGSENDVGLSGQENEGTKTNIQQNKQTDTEQT